MNGPEEFWANVDKSNCDVGCWPWKLSVDRGGYGQLRWQGRVAKAHRVAYVLSRGPIPDGLTIDHVRARGCTDKRCCKPTHLEAVTLQENIARTAGETCGRGHPKTAEHGRLREGNKWRCVTCEAITQRERRRAA